MKLQILIPQYKETDEIIRPLLDSIAIQQNVDFREVGVIIVNDGSDVRLDWRALQARYPYDVQYHLATHGGVSAARNKALDLATADYVMFCDADDMFCHACGLWVVMREIGEGFDALASCFMEETRRGGQPAYINHDNDSTFVHGKVYRRGFLEKHHIRWNDALTVHEDSYFNVLAQSMAGKVRYVHTPFYLWRWRNDSVCRHDPDYVLKTYNKLIDSADALADEFTRRGDKDKAAVQVAVTVFDAYYTMNKPIWIKQDSGDYRDATERRFAEFFNKWRGTWEDMDKRDKMKISEDIRARNVKAGMGMERTTLKDWLQKIETIWTGHQS